MKLAEALTGIEGLSAQGLLPRAGTGIQQPVKPGFCNSSLFSIGLIKF
jgi:hypothetical protein